MLNLIRATSQSSLYKTKNENIMALVFLLTISCVGSATGLHPLAPFGAFHVEKGRIGKVEVKLWIIKDRKNVNINMECRLSKVKNLHILLTFQ